MGGIDDETLAVGSAALAVFGLATGRLALAVVGGGAAWLFVRSHFRSIGEAAASAAFPGSGG